ncbi:MAG TPA: UDP-N-acetylmuramate--L-alanine ligase [Bacteroidetes bacterium]|nr:UDP-N-acetylmuramate--L-alanine ligase [Bacteroidota bacterium]HIL56990.1 UDP-N-acetylmuramate--L-alanine ligase [Rhodothermales bacterium]
MGRVRRVHMVGIGGIGMSSIAEVLIARGFEVTGSDLKKGDTTARLEDLGATIYEGHAAEHVADADVVVYSSAVKAHENPETVEAGRRLIPRIKRAEMLGELMRMRHGIGIAGTHGKTTTTTMVGLVAKTADLEPTIIVGGKVASFGSNAVSGEGDVIVVEADEYDRTFLRLTPVLAVITNIEEDHLDTYKDLDDIKDTFVEYANRVPFFGAAILCLDDENVRSVVGRIHRRVVTYGTSRQATLRAENVEQIGAATHFDVVYHSERLGSITLHAPGLHNVRNALAAVGVGLELDVPFATIAEGLAAYEGVVRRFQLKGEARVPTASGAEGTLLVVDDYAHHPTEVEATLEAAARGWPERRVVAVFQPHLYSRTRDLQHEFARAFYDADVLVVTDVYPAREEPIEGVTGELIARLARQYGHRDVHYVEDKAHLPVALAELTRAGDLVLTMGAGDVWRYGEAFLDTLPRTDG